MAWRMRKSIVMEDSPHVFWAEETAQEILRSNAEVAARFSSLPAAYPDYIKKGDVPAGIPITLTSQARGAFIKELHGPLPDALTSTIVNNRIRLAVENIEPGVHQFIPTVVTMPDGQRDDRWWSMRPCHRVDAIAFEHCEDVYEYRPQPEQHPDWFYYRSNEDWRMRLAVHSDRISGMAIWYDWRFQDFFLSEALGQSFIDLGIRGYCLPADELGRSNHVREI